MAAWRKVPEELAARFDAALPDADDVVRKRMFGCPAAFVNGNMFAGLQEERLIVRIPDEAEKRPCVIMGRRMKQYAMFSEALALAPKAMSRWLERGYAYTRALPAKSVATRRASISKTRPRARK